MVTGYFALPLDNLDKNKHKARIISKESFKVIKDKKQKVKEVKGKSLPEEIGIDPIELESGDTEENIYPELTLQGVDIGPSGTGLRIIHAIISEWIPELTKPYLAEDATTDDPLETENKKQLGIDELFIGYNIEDVYVKFPLTEGQHQDGLNEDGTPYMVDNITRHVHNGYR